MSPEHARPLAENLLGTAFYDIIDPELVGSVKSMTDELRSTHMPREAVELRVTRPGGGELWVEMHSSVIMRNGTHTAVQAIVRDISRRKEPRRGWPPRSGRRWCCSTRFITE